MERLQHDIIITLWLTNFSLYYVGFKPRWLSSKIISCKGPDDGKKQKQPKIQGNRTCWPQIQSSLPVKAVFHFWYIISFVCSTNISKTVIARIRSISLVAWMGYSQDNGIVHQIWSDKNN